jgi:hypothetical protein
MIPALSDFGAAIVEPRKGYPKNNIDSINVLQILDHFGDINE